MQLFLNSFSPADKKKYLCKQCRSNWDITSHLIRIYTVCHSVFLFFFSLDWNPYLHQWTCPNWRWRSPLQKVRDERVNILSGKANNVGPDQTAPSKAIHNSWAINAFYSKFPKILNIFQLFLKILLEMANIVDPDQTAPSALFVIPFCLKH